MSDSEINFLNGLIDLCQKHGFDIDYMDGDWGTNYLDIAVFKNANGDIIDMDDIYTYQELIKKGQPAPGVS